MPTVAVNPPKTPVTKGSSGMATATLPNICKMPGPPAPFIPTPLPNIGMSGREPSGYSQNTTMDGDPIAIQGASFGSQGDVAAQGSGGGIISSNVQGPTTFLGPGSLDVQVEGKNVQLLGDPTFNNCGPSGSPPNSATMVGVIQGILTLDIGSEIATICAALCICVANGEGQNCISRILKNLDSAMQGKSNIKAEAPYDMSTNPPTPTTYPGQRRPDAVILKDPTKPATQDNLKALVEIKLPGDDWRGPSKYSTSSQEKDFEKIAGDPDKVVLVKKEDCPCPDDPPPVAKKQEEKEEERQTSFPWLKAVAVGVVAVAVVAAAVALAPAAGAVAAGAVAAAGVAAGAAAVFGLFSSPSGAPDGA